MERPSISERWVFWYGEHTVSKECARKCGENIQGWNEEECISWAKNGFQNLLLPFEDSIEANSLLPRYVVEKLKEIAEKNAQKGNSRSPYPTSDSIFHVPRKVENLHELHNGLCIEDICLACYSLKNQDNVIYKHPLFNGGICSECRIYCTVCGSYSNMHNVCDKIDCGRLYCHYCLEAFGGRLENWQCFLCSDFLKENTVLRKRELWQLNVLKLYDESEYCETEYFPCSDFPKRKLRVLSLFDGIATDITGSGYLVFEYFRLKELLEEIQNSHIFFLFENVTHMPPKYIQQISRCFRCSPAMIDAQFFSAAHRARLFWGNIPGLRTLMTPRNSPNLQEKIVEGFGRIATREKLLTITTNSNSLRRDSYGPTPVKMDDDDVLPWVTELEDIFGFPYHYT
ncbi:Dna cytosine-5-methyltransferase 3a, partial [Gryllus bimaculatus]